MSVMIILSAVIAAAQAERPVNLPVAPFGSSYIEAGCGGGMPRRWERVRLTPDGRVLRYSTPPGAVATGHVAASRYAAFAARLDRANFEHRNDYRPTERVYDAGSCQLMRAKGERLHNVMIIEWPQQVKEARDLLDITDDVLALGRAATGAAR